MEDSGPPGFWKSEGGRRRKTPIARMSARLSSEELNEQGVDIESAGTSEDVAVLRVVSKFQSHQGPKLTSFLGSIPTHCFARVSSASSSIIVEEQELLTRTVNYQLGNSGSSGSKLKRRREGFSRFALIQKTSALPS